MKKFGVGQSVPRVEDSRLLTGHGRYTADIALPGQAHAVFLRSPHAHAEIRAIDAAAARAAPGVLAVLTATEAEADGLGEHSCEVPVKDRDGAPLPLHGRQLLARARVRFVGDTVAMAVAETALEARDAAELIDVDYAPLAAVATMTDARAGGAPALWDDVPGNKAFHWETGDAQAVDRAFGEARHRVRLDLVNNRVVPSPMEPRGVVAAFEAASGRYTLYCQSQGAHLVKQLIAQDTLKVAEDQVRVITPDVGGAFGSKIFHYPEDALTLWAARRLDRPVAWRGERSETFLCDTHGRDHESIAEAALDGEGRILAVRVFTNANMGAYLNLDGPMIPTTLYGPMISGAYRMRAIHVVVEGTYTNTTPVDAYRGAGRPEATYVIERLVDAAARQLGLAPDALRRLNFISPDDMPHRTAGGKTYDSGDFARNMDDAMRAAGWDGIAARRAEAAGRGCLRGIGMSTYVEACAGGGSEEAAIEIGGDGAVTVLIGTQSGGQGHETAYAQIASAGLGVPLAAITVVQGDTDRIATGSGTGGSRSLPVGGVALEKAVAGVIARGREVAARLLQADADKVTFADGRFVAAGGDRAMTLSEVAAAAREPENLPDGETAPGLSARARFAPSASTFPNGCHICEVEIERDTGRTRIVGYAVVDDFGTIVNPLLVTGQVHGGVAQGIGQALMEEAIYDPEIGQLLSASFMDYALPRADTLPPIRVSYNGTPCATNPMGIKGAGEAGAIAACPAVVNAVVDALAPFGINHIDMPATAEKIWRAMQPPPPPEIGETP